MNKHIYLIRGKKDEEYPAYTLRVFETGQSLLDSYDLPALKISLTSQAPPLLSVIPFRKQKIAAISVISDSEVPIPELVNAEGFAGAFKVTEAIPVSYTKDWDDGKPTPGVGLLTLFHQKKGIDQATFLDRWHNSHTPLSLKIHPLWNYNRNVVENKLTEHPGWYDGIVEEHFRSRKDLLNVFRFFGKPHQVVYRMLQVYTDTNSFLDHSRIEPYFVTEHHLRTQP